ncbi:glycosyltransferase family 4 protein [Candidatus Woesebacteria bacterium]|nr:glycosyltransferase family 4 protein [Candidatus Woesebacteria bacterium]
MKVAIDSGPLVTGHAIRGIGTHTGHLIKHLKKIKDVKVDVIDFSKNDLSKYDIVHIPSFNPFFLTLPFKKPSKKVVLTIHDLIPLIYPKHYPPGIRGRLNFFIQKILIKNVDVIITISETSKKDICRLMAVPPGKVKVIYLAPREVFREIEEPRLLQKIRKKYSLPHDFVLYVGDVNYNKNLFGLAEACKRLRVPLVIVGKQAKSGAIDRKHIENRPFVRFLNKFGGDPSIIRVGFVPDEDLAVIYNLATLYCQPSFYEGFGLAVLEAFTSGCPVIASRVQALVEIGEPACLFADPKSPKDMAEKISTVLADEVLRNQLIETGKVFVKNYSWEKTARETANVYRKVANEI